MTEDLFRADAYLRECDAARRCASTSTASCSTARCSIRWAAARPATAACCVLADGRELAIADTRKAKDAEGQPTDDILHVPAPGQAELLAALKPGDAVTARIDWERRHRLMRFHTATHLLCHLVPQPVNGCSITPDYARLDFNMTDPLDKEALTAGLARLVAAAHPLAVGAITDAELDANPALVKSMSVQPPRGTGTHPHHPHRRRDDGRSTSSPAAARMWPTPREIGAVVVTKIEKKSATTRRVVLGLRA